MFALRGIVFSHETVREWEAKLTPALAEDLRRRRKGKAGCSWYLTRPTSKCTGAGAIFIALSTDPAHWRT